MVEMADALDTLEQRLHNEASDKEKVDELQLEALEKVDMPVSVNAFVKGTSSGILEFEINKLIKKIADNPKSSSLPIWKSKLEGLQLALDDENEKVPVAKEFNFNPNKEVRRAEKEQLANLREAIGENNIIAAKALIQEQENIETAQLMTDTLKRGFYAPELIEFAEKNLQQLETLQSDRRE